VVTVVNAALNLHVPSNAGNFLSDSINGGLTKTAQMQGVI
jgi:hypothetical protein